jgi:hypothetical protein
MGADIEQGHWFGGMLSMGLRCMVVMHLLTVPMVGGNQRLPTGRQNSTFQPCYTRIERLYCLHGGIKVSRMAYHVTVRKVHNNKLM